MFKGKKAQAVKEFIFTYGMALLVILALLSVLGFYGYREAKQTLPERCEFLSGLNCLDASIFASSNLSQPSTVKVVIRNEFGFDITNISVIINGTCNSQANITETSELFALLNKEEQTYPFECQNLYKVDIDEMITLEFINIETDIKHRKTGFISLEQ
ncbi:hypothetical protein KY339_04865 [Candidatus Woesearchaeota archaeon]|nr:hypothetical protein [Candidatus Woesearchaeota archaeon]